MSGIDALRGMNKRRVPNTALSARGQRTGGDGRAHNHHNHADAHRQ